MSTTRTDNAGQIVTGGSNAGDRGTIMTSSGPVPSVSYGGFSIPTN